MSSVDADISVLDILARKLRSPPRNPLRHLGTLFDDFPLIALNELVG